METIDMIQNLNTTVAGAVKKYDLHSCSFTYGNAVRELVRDGRGIELPTPLCQWLVEASGNSKLRATVELLDIAEIDAIVDDFIGYYGGGDE